MYEVNLIPNASLGRFDNVRQFRFWAGVNAIVALVLTAASLTIAETQARLTHQIAEEERQVAPQRAAMRAIEDFREELSRSAKKVKICRSIEQRDAPLKILATAVESCRAVGEQIEISSIYIDDVEVMPKQAVPAGTRYVSSSAAARKPGSVADFAKLVRLTGTAEGDEQISALLARLQASGQFTEVELENAQPEHAQSALRSFRIRCRH